MIFSNQARLIRPTSQLLLTLEFTNGVHTVNIRPGPFTSPPVTSGVALFSVRVVPYLVSLSSFLLRMRERCACDLSTKDL